MYPIPSHWSDPRGIPPGDVIPPLPPRQMRHSSATPAPPEIPADPVAFARTLGIQPDPVQSEILRCPERNLLVCCSRQWGKSTVAGLKAAHLALTRPATHIVIASRTDRQAGRIVERLAQRLAPAGVPFRLTRRGDRCLRFPNGSLLRAIPNNPAGERGLDGVHVLIIDEAAFTQDALYIALQPTLATTGGATWLFSTPNLTEGYFYQAWDDTAGPWRRFHVPAHLCPRISPEFLAETRAKIGDTDFRREYLAEFISASGSLFHPSALEHVRGSGPLDEPAVGAAARTTWFAGLDLGQRRDHTALAVVRRVLLPSRTRRDPVTWEWLQEETLEVVALHVFPLHQTYAEMSGQILRLLSEAQAPCRIRLAVDNSSVGGELVSTLTAEAKRIARIVPVTITSGAQPSVSRYGHNIPRRDLLNRLAAALERRELLFSPSVPPPDRAQLLSSLQAIRADYTCAPGRHDDLPIALSLALWSATHQ